MRRIVLTKDQSGNRCAIDAGEVSAVMFMGGKLQIFLKGSPHILNFEGGGSELCDMVMSGMADAPAQADAIPMPELALPPGVRRSN